MGFFQRLTSLFSSRPVADRRYLPIYVVSQRCREPIAAQVDLMNELSLAEEGGPPYFARKVLHSSGRNRCFDQVEVQLWFDANKQVASHEVIGGRWLSAEEYRELLAERAAAEEDAQAAKAAAQAGDGAAQEADPSPKDETGD